MKMFGCFLDSFFILSVHRKLNSYCSQYSEAVELNFEYRLKLLCRIC